MTEKRSESMQQLLDATHQLGFSPCHFGFSPPS